MFQLNFKIPIYTWNLTIILLKDKKDAEELRKIAEKYKFPDIDNLMGQVEEDSYNGGKTYTKRNTRDIVMVIFPHTSKSSIIGTINHEKRHVIDDILEWHDIHDKEAAAYLDGWLSEKLYKQLNPIKTMKK